MYTINDRFRDIRLSLKITQEEMGEKIGITKSGVSAIESGARNVIDKHILMLQQAYNVNPEWLRTGNGSMFIETDASLLGQLADHYKLSGVEQTIMASFLSLSEKNRAVILDFVKATVSRIVESNADELRPYLGASVADSFAPSASLADSSINAEVEAYRQELLSEKKATEKSDPSAITGA